ncbi:MAG TPA: transporter associated domain-containing protein [Burkholderiales bacterium]|nr:transporter associated domain-containing protein [Burkholderiales bacterium]
MSRSSDDHHVGADEAAPHRSLLDRLTQALLGEPATRDELLHVLREAAERDLIDRESLDMIEGVLQVSEMKVREIMVPRSQMEVVDKNLAPEAYLPMVIESGHSRFPVVDGDKDKVVGILLAKELLRYFQLDKRRRAQFKLLETLRPAVFVPESKRLNVLLRDFKANRNHMAIVVDEYGGVAGLVTIEDVLEQIVGEIADEYDIDEDTMIMPRDNGEFVVKALTPIGELNERLKVRLSAAEVDTVGGIVMTTLGRLPRRGDRVTVNGLQFEVLRADSRRVHLLKVSRVSEVEPAEPGK